MNSNRYIFIPQKKVNKCSINMGLKVSILAAVIKLFTTCFEIQNIVFLSMKPQNG